jgi:hypothetical protein
LNGQAAVERKFFLMQAETKLTHHIGELSADPLRPLTQYEIDHFDEYLIIRNDDISAKDVSLTEAVQHVIANMDFYLGVPGAKLKAQTQR